MEGVEKCTADQNIMEFQAEAEERVRKISSELRWEILQFGGAENIMLQKRKKTKKKYSQMPATGPVDTAEFVNAAIQGKLKVIERYLAEGGNPNVYDELKRTALHRVSMEGHSSIVQKLFEKGDDIHFKDRLDSRVIHWACRSRSLEVVQMLKNHGADLNVQDKLYSTPLHVANRTGHIAIVEFFLSCDVNINCRDREGDTALHDVVRLNRHKIVICSYLLGQTQISKTMYCHNVAKIPVVRVLQEGVMAAEQVKQWHFDTVETLEQLGEVKLVPSDNATARY